MKLDWSGHSLSMRVLRLGLALGLLVVLSFMFFPKDRDWQRIDDTVGTVKTLGLAQSMHGSRVFAVIDFDDNPSIKIGIPVDSNLLAGDEIVFSTFADKDDPTKRKYVIQDKLSEE